MTTLYLDEETFCEEPIRSGLHKYAEKVEVILLAYAFDDDEPTVDEFPTADYYQFLVDQADTIVIQNSAFDRTTARHALGVIIPTEKIVDTMVQALAHGLPGGLDKLCPILGVPADQAKDKAGKQLIQLFCKPPAKNLKRPRATKATHPVEWQRFKDYAASDIRSMREVHKRLPKWNYPNNAREHALWQLDQKINDRGVAVDVDLAAKAVDLVALTQKALAKRTQELTNGEVEAASKRDQMLRHILSEYGVDLPDMQKATLERRIEDPDLPEPLKELLRVRLMTATTATSKFKALMKSVSSDGRLRGLLQFCGAARTGRWAGRIFQPQNLPRTPKAWKKRIEEVIAYIKAECADLCLELDEVMPAISAVIRGVMVAADDHKLVASDLSNIEGRMLAWLAGAQWKLDAFADGTDLYMLGYSRSFNVPLEVVQQDEADGGTMRLIGKVQELALGYQGAVGAFQKMAAGYGVELSEKRVLEIVKGFRKANSDIVDFWYELERAAIRAISSPGTRVVCGKLVLQRDGSWLRIRLPSGRYLCYPGVQMEDGKMTYMGQNQYTRKWERLRTYGGKLVENVTQAAARDVMAHNMALAEDAGYSIVLTVHDEIVTEPLDNGQWTSDGLSRLLSAVPPWAQGLPLAAEGYEAKRYRK